MKWISTKIKFPESGEQVLTACKNMNMKDGIWLYDLCRYYPNVGWENRVNWEEILYWKYIDKPKEERIMEQYIPKSALVAEIERRIKEHHSGYLVCLKDMLSFIDTLEVKEVDLDTEIMKYQREIYDRDTTVRDVAKHFFKLGLKAQKGE